MAVRGNTFGATITIISTNASYHTYRDWGIVVSNGDPVGDPEQETNYITVRGRPGLLDCSESLTGEPVFKGRRLTFDMVLQTPPDQWNMTVSKIRNRIDGRRAKVFLDDDPSHYWLGRISVKNTSRVMRCGRFTLEVYADAYKYEKASSQEKLRWDDMNFLTDCLRYIGTITVSGQYTLVIPKGEHAVVPTIKVTNITSQTFSMSIVGTGKSYALVAGTNRFPDFKVCGTEDVTISFGGSAKVTLTYRGESL